MILDFKLKSATMELPIDSIHSIFKEIYRRHQFSDSNQSRCVNLIKSSRNNEVRKSQIGTEYT
jgi:hypothetical protein